MTRLFGGRMADVTASLAATGVVVIAAAVIAGSATAAPPAAAAAAGDPVAGKVIFAKCAICHSVVPGQNKLGPSLAGVIGRKPASIPNYVYSPAMMANTKAWTPAQLDTYLTNPRAVVPGTKMIFAGLPSPTDRANVIAYLKNPAAVK